MKKLKTHNRIFFLCAFCVHILFSENVFPSEARPKAELPREARQGRRPSEARLLAQVRQNEQKKMSTTRPDPTTRRPFRHSRCFLPFKAQFWVLTNFFWVSRPSNTFTTWHLQKIFFCCLLFFVQPIFCVTGDTFSSAFSKKEGITTSLELWPMFSKKWRIVTKKTNKNHKFNFADETSTQEHFLWEHWYFFAYFCLCEPDVHILGTLI